MSKRVKMAIMATAAFITIAGLLFAGDWFYQTTQVNQPLQKEIAAISGIQRVELVKDSQKPTLAIRFHRDAQVEEAWREVIEVLARYPGGAEAFSFDLGSDEPTVKITQAYGKLQFSVYEALATGNFTKIPEALDEVSGEIGIQGQAYLIEDYLLLALKDDETIFYQAIPLQEVS